jgi:trehalose synthase
MLQTVDVGTRSLSAYRDIVPGFILDELERRAEGLRGARVVHLNATPYGGGVSELLRSLVPLLSGLGLVADWKVISGDDELFGATKTLHNALQGAEPSLDGSQRRAYERAARRNAELLEEEYDVVVVHDPQPAAVLSFRGKGSARWVWRCHIDTSDPNPDAWAFLRGYLGGYDAAVFTMHEFVPPDLPIERADVIPPAIDPLSPKNLSLAEATAREVLQWIGVDSRRPLLTQVSRFDPWKDPLGVIASYRLAREAIPSLQLALAGSMALDDPQAWEVYREIMAASERDPLIHVFTNLTGVGNVEVNAFQRLSDVCVQKSIREAFGLVVSESLWKGTPVVAGRAGGIPLQMADGVGGVLVESVEECARAIVDLFADPERARELGRTGRERVREHFLLPRLLLNELCLLEDLLAAQPRRALAEDRDPVCGMMLPAGEPTLSETADGRTYRFCSAGCRARFRLQPERYLPAYHGELGAPLPIDRRRS